jgi:hypothetical protein
MLGYLSTIGQSVQKEFKQARMLNAHYAKVSEAHKRND